MAGGVLARRGVGSLEQRIFGAVNNLPAAALPPVWAVMQLGSLGGALGVSAAVAAAARPALGRRMAVTGTLTWAAAKVVKRYVGRGRPGADGGAAARVLGRPQTGLGYPSGHAAVAASLAAVVARDLHGGWRRGAWSLALLVGPTRMFVGAHLPLDVAGGVCLGVAIGAGFRAQSGQTG